MIIPIKKIYKVSSNARLSGIKGSPQQRELLAENLNVQLEVLMNDIFQKHAANGEEEYITMHELKESFHKVCKQDININLRKNYEKNSKDCVSLLFNSFYFNKYPFKKEKLNSFKDHIVLETFVDGFDVFLPFNDSKYGYIIKKDQKIKIIKHEFKHVFDFITQPKLSLSSSNLSYESFKFYEKFLYSKKFNCGTNWIYGLLLDSSKDSGLKATNLTLFKKIKQLRHNQFILNLKDEIDKHLKGYHVLHKNKVLHYWMNQLNMEKTARLNALNEDYAKFHFDEKLNLLKSLLKDAIIEKRNYLKQIRDKQKI